jgi:hypothetical protein
MAESLKAWFESGSSYSGFKSCTIDAFNTGFDTVDLHHPTRRAINFSRSIPLGLPVIRG